jgi:uncharacterized repeat protein (TIGR01451 family)
MKNAKITCLFVLLLMGMSLFQGCSCNSWHTLMGNGPAEPKEAFFWDKECKAINAKPNPAKAAKKAAPQPKPEVMNRTIIKHPCNDCGIIKIEKIMPASVQLGKTFEYYIIVTNLTNGVVEDVHLTEVLADNFKFASASPKAVVEGKVLSWMMDSLAANAQEKIKITGTATSADTLTHCANATYKMPACAMTKVVEPKLAISKTATDKVVICDKVMLKYTVTNTGTGVTKGVKISEKLPEGLVGADGSKAVSLNVGDLAPGASKTMTVMATAQKTGVFQGKAMASADGDMKAESAMTKTVVTKPVLTIAKSGRESQYLGRKVVYSIKVTNTGDAVAEDVTVEDMISANAKFVSASDGGKVAAGKVAWKLGDMAPKASKTVKVAYMPAKIGKVGGKAATMADCAQAATVAAMTDVEGIAAVLLEVIDVSDPIEVGSNETYKVTVTNQGSATETNVDIEATLSDKMQYVSSSGQTAGTFAEGKVKFASLARLAPKAKASWTITVKAVKAGDVRIKVVMNADQLESEVMETEATKFYE